MSLVKSFLSDDQIPFKINSDLTEERIWCSNCGSRGIRDVGDSDISVYCSVHRCQMDVVSFA